MKLFCKTESELIETNNNLNEILFNKKNQIELLNKELEKVKLKKLEIDESKRLN